MFILEKVAYMKTTEDKQGKAKISQNPITERTTLPFRVYSPICIYFTWLHWFMLSISGSQTVRRIWRACEDRLLGPIPSF